jgi:hypothetical protein
MERKVYGRALVGLSGLATAWLLATPLTPVVAQSPDDISASIVRITTPTRQGTGVVVALDNSGATILTASHVLLGAQEYEVIFAADPNRTPVKSSPATLRGWEPDDETYGLAAFRVSAPIPSAVKAAVFGSADSLHPLDGLVYNGYPNKTTSIQYFALNFSAPAGRTFSTDRAVGEGASGGAIVRAGKVVGIASARSGVQTFAVKAEVVLSTLRGWKIQLPDPGATAGNGTNRPPTAGSIGVTITDDSSSLSTNRIGLMAATKFTLSAKDVSDPDGDPLTYIWDFGDGSAAPPSAPTVEKIYRDVNKFRVRLQVTDGKHPNVLAGETDITIRDVTGTWLLTIKNDPNQPIKLPERMIVTLNQKGNLLDGRIVPENSNRPTVLSGEVRHSAKVWFGSESAWWNDGDDAYFELKVSDGFLAVQMTNAIPGRCGASLACQSAFFQKQ